MTDQRDGQRHQGKGTTVLLYKGMDAVGVAVYTFDPTSFLRRNTFKIVGEVFVDFTTSENMGIYAGEYVWRDGDAFSPEDIAQELGV